jgi:hypothetical protein
MVSSPTLLDADRHTSQMHKQSNFFEDSSDPSRFRKKNQQYFTKARWMTCVPIGKLLASSVTKQVKRFEPRGFAETTGLRRPETVASSPMYVKD